MSYNKMVVPKLVTGAHWEERQQNPWGDVLGRGKTMRDIDAPPPNTEKGPKTKNRFLKRERQYGNKLPSESEPALRKLVSQVPATATSTASSQSSATPTAPLDRTDAPEPAFKKAKGAAVNLEDTEDVGVGDVDGKEVLENRLYVGNLDKRVSEYMVLQLFKRYGRIVKEQFMWHIHGPRRGEPRGYCFVEYSTRAEALLAKEKLNGRITMGKAIVVRFVNERVNFQPVQMGPVVTEKLRKNGPALEWANQAKKSDGDSETAAEAAIVDSKLEALKRKIQQLKNKEADELF